MTTMTIIMIKIMPKIPEQPDLNVSKKPSPLLLKTRPITKSNNIKPIIPIIEKIYLQKKFIIFGVMMKKFILYLTVETPLQTYLSAGAKPPVYYHSSK
jgi:hypothetical protein